MELFEVAHFLNLVSMVGFDCEDLRMLSFFFGLSTLIRQADYKKNYLVLGVRSITISLKSNNMYEVITLMLVPHRGFMAQLRFQL